MLVWGIVEVLWFVLDPITSTLFMVRRKINTVLRSEVLMIIYHIMNIINGFKAVEPTVVKVIEMCGFIIEEISKFMYSSIKQI